MKNKDIFINKVGAKNTMGNEQECRENGMKTWPGEEHSVWTVLFLLLKKTVKKRQRKSKKKWKIQKKNKKMSFRCSIVGVLPFSACPDFCFAFSVRSGRRTLRLAVFTAVFLFSACFVEV